MLLARTSGKENKWIVGIMSEYRHQIHEGVSKTNQYFVRPSFSYKVLPWLRLQYQMDFAATASSGFNWRFIPEFTMSHKVGYFSRNSFAWFQKARWYAGFNVKLTDNLTLTPQYVCQAYHNHKGHHPRRTYDDHVIYVTFTVKL